MCSPENKRANSKNAKQVSNPPVQRNAVQNCEESPAQIQFVEFLNGDNNTLLSSNGKQFTNFPAADKWVDGTRVENRDRLSIQPRIKVRFNRAGAHQFQMKHLLIGQDYTNTEKGRNDNFKYEDQEKSYTTDGDGTKIIESDFPIHAAGKNKFRVQAKDQQGTTRQSHEIENHRIIYYQEIKMAKQLPDSTYKIVPAKGTAKLRQELAKHNITVVRASGRGSVVMDHVENIGSDTEEDEFLKKARKAYKDSGAKDKKPYVVAIAFTDHLGVKDTKEVSKDNVDVGPGNGDVVIPMVDDATKTHSLWRDMVSNEDWFVEAGFTGTKVSDGSPYQAAITKRYCTPVVNPAYNPSDSEEVSIKVNHLEAARGTITIKVNWVDRFRGGLSFDQGNLICVSTRAFWDERSEDKQVRTIIHEMGHKLGMVPDGTGKLPDKPPKYYYKRGGHCDEDGKACVMYGVSNNIKAFCSDCGKALHKMDLSEGWSDF